MVYPDEQVAELTGCSEVDPNRSLWYNAAACDMIY